MIERDDIWLVMAALGGTITALGQTKYKDMTWSEIAFSLLSGLAFAVFAVKPAAEHFTDNSDVVAAMVYLGGAGWNILLPAAIMRLKRVVGEKGLL